MHFRCLWTLFVHFRFLRTLGSYGRARMLNHEKLPEGAGPCVKQTVRSTIVTPSGDRYVGTNWIAKPQGFCPRAGLATGVGYELCRDVCQQAGHSEVQALKLAGPAAKGGKLYLEGHTYACEPCLDAAREAGIVEVIIGAPPA